MADWSQLPYDLVVHIANQLHAVEDFLKFSAVCHSWRFVYLNKNWNPSRPSPFLVLSEDRKKSKQVSKRQMFSISSLKMYNVAIPEAQGCRCWGSCHGWIVTVNQSLEIFLVNPIERVRLDLPPYSTLGLGGGNQDMDTNILAGWFGIISRAYVFKIQQVFVTVAIYGKRYNLAIARCGDSAWTSLPSPINFVNAACLKDQILALSMVGTLYLIEISGSDSPRALYVASAPEDEKGWQNIYLVESMGNLLMVLFYETGGQWPSPDIGSSMRFKVYKFDDSSRTWSVLKGLGERALLVDDYSCISVSASGYIKRNRIYHARDGVDCWLTRGSESCRRRQYMNAFNMEDGSFQVHHIDAVSPACYVSPVWLLPTYHL